MQEELLARWTRLVGDAPAALAAGETLLKRYAHPDRHYHNLTHLSEVLAAIDELGPHAGDLTAVRLGAWFHDAVYDRRPGVDEESSAQLAERLLPDCGVEEARVREVGRLVRLTAHHDPPTGDANGAVLCDADLWILAAPARRYIEYARGVRAEYAHLSDNAFRAGRRAVLQHLLAHPTLYRTASGQRRWESRARHNLAAELARLDETERSG